MRLFTKYYKRLRITRIKTSVWVIFIAAFLFPSFVEFEKTGNNIFQVYVNGSEVGVVSSVEEIDPLLMQARARVARNYEDIILIETQVSYQGSEVIYGKVDSEDTVISRMANVLRKDIKKTLQRSYTIKIDDYSVNLSSAEEVIQLLRASLQRFDLENEYDVELTLDPNRELNVLSANVYKKATVLEEEKEVYNEGAGIESAIDEMFDQVEPEKEKEFSDFELGLVDLSYSDTVEVVESYLLDESLTLLEQAVEVVTKEQEKNQIYEVVAGDTLSGIAVSNNLTLEKLIELNKFADEFVTIRVGDELIITIPEPELSVIRKEEMYYEETYDADIIYVDNDSWYTTQTKVLQEPSSGYRKVVAVVSFRNEYEMSREILKQEVVMEAVPKIVERGTITPPTYIKPISGGRLSSGFGKRSAPTRGASTYHKGIDWSIPTGTSVFASSGGTVAKAGWASGYGYVVFINHADGRQTRYGHLSKVLVKSGQYVSQGDKIALSGNSGISTGPHLHFEILINGVQVNPLKYLD